jgi:hypothetical protein
VHQRQVGGLSNGDKNVGKHKKIQKKRKDKLDDLAKEITATGVGKISQKYSTQPVSPFSLKPVSPFSFFFQKYNFSLKSTAYIDFKSSISLSFFLWQNYSIH